LRKERTGPAVAKVLAKSLKKRQETEGVVSPINTTDLVFAVLLMKSRADRKKCQEIR